MTQHVQCWRNCKVGYKPLCPGFKPSDRLFFIKSDIFLHYLAVHNIKIVPGATCMEVTLNRSVSETNHYYEEALGAPTIMRGINPLILDLLTFPTFRKK